MHEELSASKSPASDFHSAALDYCAWCEQHRPEGPADQAKMALELLARLYVSALNLPASQPDGEAPEVEEVTQDTWRSIYDSFEKMPFCYYGVVLEPHALPPGEAGVGDLADDLADIYRDLKNGMNLWAADHVVEAVWHWRKHFGFHWGRHVAAAVHALHTWLERAMWLEREL